jgi:triosephosphate isomerase
MRKKYVAGNWKMNLNHSEALGLSEFVGSIESHASLLVFPPFIYLSEIKNRFPNLNVGAQNFHPKDKGAFTGEVSIEQLKNIGVTHVLIGHSERRQIFNESNEFIKENVLNSPKKLETIKKISEHNRKIFFETNWKNKIHNAQKQILLELGLPIS